MITPDRGPARYFHGRQSILQTFAEWCNHAVEHRSGTIFLVQGAPGAGKTALLTKCEELAVNAKWLVANIETDALHNINALRAYLDTRLRWLSDLEGLSVSGFGAAWKNTRHIWEVLRRTAKAQDGGGLLLILDEVQHLHDLSTEEARLTRPILNQIHNGKLGVPVMLLAGGLGTSQGAFEKLGISRFSDGCLVHLGRLSTEAERAVLHDWLTRDGQAREDVTPWIDAIAKETHGWPHHIVCFAAPAAHRIKADGGRLAASGLGRVLQMGQEKKKSYYQERTGSFENADILAIGKMISQYGAGREYARENFKSLGMRPRYTEAQREALFEQLLHKGVIAKNDHRLYEIPIPSMSDWLASEYRNRNRPAVNRGLSRNRDRETDIGRER